MLTDSRTAVQALKLSHFKKRLVDFVRSTTGYTTQVCAQQLLRFTFHHAVIYYLGAELIKVYMYKTCTLLRSVQLS